MTNFKEQYLQGIVSIKDLDSFVSNWHKDPKGLDLQEYLGLTDEEFEAFAHGETNFIRKLTVT